MDISIPLKVAGIIVSVGLAYWRIKSSKKLKDKVGLNLLTHTAFPLLTTFKHRFESINIEFTLPVNTNVFYYKGSIFNTGTLDVDKQKIYKPLTLSFPEGCKILECKILNAASDQIDVHKVIKDNHLLLTWDLLKPKEYFTFELIIDSESINNSDTLEEGIATSHRISDLGIVNTLNISTVKPTSLMGIFKAHSPSLFPLFLITLVVIFFLTMEMITGPAPTMCIDHDLIYKPTNEMVYAEYLNDSTIKLEKNNKEIVEMNINDFEKNIYLKPELLIAKNDYSALIAAGIFIAFFIPVFIVTYRGIVQEIRKQKIIQHLRDTNN